MCIALISTSHPSYPLIVIDNRDEYLRRPTSAANWWPEPSANVLGGRDLARSIHGTWMGVTREGKIAVLTNYREKTSDEATGIQSRGAIVNSWLVAAESREATRDFVQRMVGSATARKVGGFSLVCGYVKEPLAIVSNRADNMEQIRWVASRKGETLGLSNTSVDDRSWPKILEGEKLVEEAIAAHVSGEGEDEDELIRKLLALLSRNTLPTLSEDATAEDYLPYFRQSIFIPLLGRKEGSGKASQEEKAGSVCGEGLPDQSYLHGPYGTQKQTVFLVRDDGTVRYFERTLYDNDVKAIPIGEGDRSFEFQLQ
ncbi:hypothetical protein EYZ11_000848 [Aspergillus tanneri]|uniref:DUF833 domain-containing protein n=1 Tax=Aspergillus tanneri TaxID=1220188 RepID=A0A4S3JW90_9EURO|nr:hypothetical protein EYZ11_000848 [Aspergillus tanneri]